MSDLSRERIRNCRLFIWRFSTGLPASHHIAAYQAAHAFLSNPITAMDRPFASNLPVSLLFGKAAGFTVKGRTKKFLRQLFFNGLSGSFCAIKQVQINLALSRVLLFYLAGIDISPGSSSGVSRLKYETVCLRGKF
jgi:hypothetical protein